MFTVSPPPPPPLCSSHQIEEENAALLAALTDSLDGMVDAEVGGLSVFPTLGEEPEQDEEEEDGLPLGSRGLSSSLGSETEDPSLVSQQHFLCLVTAARVKGDAGGAHLI